MHRTLFVLLFSLIITAMPTASFAQSEETPITGAASVYCPQLSQTMVRGARDRTTIPPGQVTELQKFISDYYDVDPDDIVTGYFGSLTHGHVVRFQREQNLPSFGIVGPLTRAAIARVSGENTPPAAQSCNFNGKTIADGTSFTAYASSTVAYGGQCRSETRTCIKGVLTGSYGYATCTVGTTPDPTLSFTSKDAKVAPGQQTTLTWVSTNAAWCSASGGWSGTKATYALFVSGTIWGTTTFTLTCFSADGLKSATKSVTVAVIEEEPAQVQPTFSATPNSGTAPLTVSFAGNGLRDPYYYSYAIDFGDGQRGFLPKNCGNSCDTTSSINHTYAAAGTYVATLREYNDRADCGDSISCSKTIGTITINVSIPEERH